MELIHVAIPVADLSATKRFYSDGLGFTPSHEFEGDDGLENVYVRDDVGTELQFTYDPDRLETGPFPRAEYLRQHIAIGVPNVDDTFDALVEACDPPVLSAPAPEAASGSRIAFVEDPNGHAVELVDRNENS